MASNLNVQSIELPNLRVKKPHRKSRFGCNTCKRRRVKCDESKPVCSQCQNRGLGAECVYVERSDRTTLPTSSSSPDATGPSISISSPSSVSSPDEFTPNPGGVTDAELVQHYLEHTVETFFITQSNSADMRCIWKYIIPALAQTSTPVRRGMLTLAAVCSHFDTTGENEQSSRYLIAAETHGEVFVRESQQQLRRFQPTEFNAILVCSRLLCVLGFAFFRIHRHNGFTLADSPSWTWLELLRGVPTAHVAIFQSGHSVEQALLDDTKPEVAMLGRTVQSSIMTTSVTPKHPLFFFIDETLDDRFHTLHTALRQSAPSLSPEQGRDMLSAIRILHGVSVHICSGEMNSLFRSLCTWAGEISRGFVDMIIEGHPLALAIYSHWLMLLVLAEDLWWINDMGRSGILEILEMHPEAGDGVQMILEWPRRMLEIDTLQ